MKQLKPTRHCTFAAHGRGLSLPELRAVASAASCEHVLRWKTAATPKTPSPRFRPILSLEVAGRSKPRARQTQLARKANVRPARRRAFPWCKASCQKQFCTAVQSAGRRINLKSLQGMASCEVRRLYTPAILEASPISGIQFLGWSFSTGTWIPERSSCMGSGFDAQAIHALGLLSVPRLGPETRPRT